jgi:PKHD-type hydroxylase
MPSSATFRASRAAGFRRKATPMMFLADVLSPDGVAATMTRAAKLHFVDGRSTAGWAATTVKHNLQADAAGGPLDALRQTLTSSIAGHALFALAARPQAFAPLLISRYEPGMSYGSHVDDAMMGDLRADLSFTLFLSPADSYDGGELVMESAAGEQAVKLPAGSMVLYPSTTLHRVAPVTRGVRLAAVGWVQSLIRDAHKREILFDLETARRALFTARGKTNEFDLLSKCASNLIRMWAEP